MLTLPLHVRILIGLVGGGLLGGILHSHAAAEVFREGLVLHFTEPVGQLFLRVLLLMVIPLVFSSLVVGVANIGDIRKIGRVGFKSFGFSLVFSSISVAIGLTLAAAIQPGGRLDETVKRDLQARYGQAAQTTLQTVASESKKEDSPLMSVVKTIAPTNIFAAISNEPPKMLGLMFFALFIGVSANLAGTKARSFLSFFESSYDVITKCIDLVMQLAPYAVFCLIFSMTARFGFGLISGLGWFVLTVLLGLSIQMFGVYSLALIVLGRVNPIEFFRRIRVVIVTAFSTASSNATLPTAMRVSEKNLGVPREINSFVLTVGATANQNGTALYEGVTVLFLAQLAGVDLTLGQQLVVLYMAILSGIGTAGVPGGSIPFVILLLSTIGVEPALIAVILGIDRFLDMCRTVLNVVGDMTIAAYVARSEGAKLMPAGGTAGY